MARARTPMLFAPPLAPVLVPKVRRLLIGRSPDSDLVIASRRVSREHAEGRVTPYQAVDHLIDGPVASRYDHGIPMLQGSLTRHPDSITRALRPGELDGPSLFDEEGTHPLQLGCHVPRAGGGVVDQTGIHIGGDYSTRDPTWAVGCAWSPRQPARSRVR